MENLEAIVDLKVLPYQMQQLIRCIGMAQTLELLRLRGGTPVYIPKGYISASLGKILSQASVVALAESELAGKSIELPKSDKYHQQLRNYAIRQSKGELSGSQAATLFNLSRRMITEIRRDGGQGDLFD